MEENAEEKSFYAKLLTGLIIVALVGLLVFFIIINSKNIKHKSENTATINLNETTSVNTLEDIYIAGTDDLFIITEEVRWNSSNSKSTESFEYQIPYQFVVDGKEYNGTYMLGDDTYLFIEDGNEKYNIKIKDITKDGKVKVLITEK